MSGPLTVENFPPERAVKSLANAYEKLEGKSWEPPDMNHLVIQWGIRNGYLQVCDAICGYERIKDCMVRWTDAGRSAIVAFKQKAEIQMYLNKMNG